MKVQCKRLWALALACLLAFSGAIPVFGEENQEKLPVETVPDREPAAADADSGITLNADYLYSEISQDGTSQGIIIRLDTDQTLESAVLTSKNGEEEEITQASQLIQNYASFFLPVSDNRTYVSLETVIQGAVFHTDLSPLQQGQTLDYEALAAQDGEASPASYSLDEETAKQAEAVEGSVLSVSIDESVSGQDIAASIANTAPASKARTAAAPENKSGKKVVVLDPGHGAAGSGTYRDWGDFVIDEAVITLKISKYTKEALEANYENLEVYLTRTKQSENPSLAARVDFAVSKHADILVSQHVNATTENITSAHGVLAMVPRVDSSHQYHAETAQEAQKLARTILDELVALGFNDMGFQTPLSQTGDTYEDGSLADYYGIIRRCRIANLPGTIIEHGFANNREDALKLNNEAMLKKIAEADAKGIAAYLGLSEGSSTPNPSPEVITGWKQSDGKWYYYDANGNKTTGWQKVGDYIYYMDDSGVMLTGWQQISGKWYYLNPSGAMFIGWLNLDNTWYYMNASGERMTGWQTINGKKYYLDNSGKMLTGWQQIDGSWYFLDSSGALDPSKVHPSSNIQQKAQWIASGGRWWYRHANGSYTTSNWEKINGEWYYFDASGWMLTGWQIINGAWYYMDASGKMLTGWQSIGGAWYYMNTSGRMLTGWQSIDGAWYYLNTSGKMLTGWQSIGGAWYYLNTSGRMLTGWQSIGGAWYYMNGSGRMASGWQLINGSWYYLSSSGRMLTGWQWIGGKCYYLNNSGAMAADTWVGTYYVDGSGAWVQNASSQTNARWISSGGRWWYRHADGDYTASDWEKINGQWYYFDASGWMLTGWQKINGPWYYMDDSGKMLTGWQSIGGSWYYMNSSGQMLTGWQLINRSWYYMNTSGRMLTGWQTINGSKYYLDSTGKMLTGTQTINGETYIFRSNGALAS